jgi:hypothetical protein
MMNCDYVTAKRMGRDRTYATNNLPDLIREIRAIVVLFRSWASDFTDFRPRPYYSGDLVALGQTQSNQCPVKPSRTQSNQQVPPAHGKCID